MIDADVCPIVLSIDNDYIVDLIRNEITNRKELNDFVLENSDCIIHRPSNDVIFDEDVFTYVDNILKDKEDRFTVMFFLGVWWVKEKREEPFKLLEVEVHEEIDPIVRDNVSAFARYMLFADRFAYYCFHAIARNTDENGLKKNRYLHNWAFNSIKDMIDHLPFMIKFCTDNTCRLYAGANARSSIKTALAISNDMTDYVNVELDHGSTFGVQGIRKVFGSVSQRVISRHPGNSYKFYMLDVDFKDEPEDKRKEVLNAVYELIDSPETKSYELHTTHGVHIVTTYTGGSKYKDFRDKYGQYVDIKKDPIVFIGNFS